MVHLTSNEHAHMNCINSKWQVDMAGAVFVILGILYIQESVQILNGVMLCRCRNKGYSL